MRTYAHNACVCACVHDILNRLYSYIHMCGVSVCVCVCMHVSGYVCTVTRMYGATQVLHVTVT